MQSPRLFVSIGTRFAMDRLLNAVAEISERHTNYRVTAQIGRSKFHSPNVKSEKWLNNEEFKKQVEMCDVFVSHAGMGNILLAAHLKKPIIVMPRQFALNEHTNNHQISTAEAMLRKGFVKVVNNASELEQTIESILTSSASKIEYQASYSRSSLINTLKDFIESGQR